ncbi:1583_t:CDS:2 [Diversispora eburnea]|uniref:1583_t:CDS:1 n=1 Tax=Diversispora eburnea TaxID=1213867 RepID=A0A9N9BKI7_9GLOM|nr:1583_t:CDS:2 [Diversispora eburnea]
MEQYSGLKIKYSTVSKILKKANKYQLQDNNVYAEKTFCYRSVKYPMLELAINMWVEHVTTEGIIISDSIIKEKAHHFAEAFSILEELFTFSNRLALISFIHWLLALLKNERFHIQDQQALLLVDNTTSHIAPETIETWDDDIDNIDYEMSSENNSIDKIEEL